MADRPAARRRGRPLARDPQSTSLRTAEAAFHLAETWQLPTPATDIDMNLGIAALESFLERYPTHKQAADARVLIARTYVGRGRGAEARPC